MICMVNHSLGLRHFSMRKRARQDKRRSYQDKLTVLFDKIIYAVVFIAPILNLPQLFEVWFNRNAAGVSFISWFGFSILSVVWLIYGILHKEKPLIFMNIALAVVQGLVALGVVLYG